MSFGIFPCFAVFGGHKIPRCREKQHEKCHCDTPCCAPQMLRAVSQYASRQSTGEMTNRPHLAHIQYTEYTPRRDIISKGLKWGIGSVGGLDQQIWGDPFLPPRGRETLGENWDVPNLQIQPPHIQAPISNPLMII